MDQKEKNLLGNTTSPTVNEKATAPDIPADVKDIGQAPAIAGNANHTAAHDIGIKFENAVKAQNQQNMLGQPATTQGAKPPRKEDTIADLVAIAKILKP